MAIPVAGATLVGGEAAACFPEACEYYEQWTTIDPLNAAAIPIDGVLVLQATLAARPIERVGQEGPLPHVTLVVTRDGEPVAGALEASEVDQVIVWRPAAPLLPGATYEVTGSLDNAEGAEFCASATIPIEFEFHVDDGPAAPLVAPTVGASERVELRPRTGIDDLACCDGAYPSQGHSDCGGPSGAVEWSDGACTPVRGVGWIEVELSLTHALPPATAQLVTRRAFRFGKPLPAGFVDTLEVEAAEPFCTQVLLHNLATGETVMTDEVCHGDAVAEQLGEQDIDPVAALAGQCEGPVYTCSSDASMFETRWDDAACLPWGEAEDGCDCASDSSGAAWWFAAIVPALARRRRSPGRGA